MVDKNEFESLRMLGRAEVCTILGITGRTFTTWVTTGVLPAYKIANAWKVKPDELVAFINARSNQNDTPNAAE